LSPVPDDASEGDGDVTEPSSVEPDATAAPGRGLLAQLSDDLAALRQRIEVVQQDVVGLVARVHTLGGAVAGVEVTLGGRLSEYSDTVVQLGRGLTANISTYRESNDRTVSELRRALADSEELLRTVLTKADDLAVEIAAVRNERTADAPAAPIDADELREIVHETIASFDARDSVGKLATELAALGDRITKELAARPLATPGPSGVDAAVHAELLTALEVLRTDVVAAVEEMRAEVDRLRRAGAKPTKPATTEHERALVGELEAMREEIAQLKRRIAVRAKATGIDDEQIAAIAEAVAQRISEAFEVVPEA
jgi:hypothetical protein